MSKDLFAELSQLPRPFRMVPFPRVNPDTGVEYCHLAMMVLTAEEIAMVTAEAEKKAKKALSDNKPTKEEASIGYQKLFEDYTIEGILFRSCKHPEELDKKFFPSQESIFKVLTTDEAGILFNHYCHVSAELGPIVGTMTNEEYESWIKRITDSGTDGRFFLNSFTSDALKELVMYMANQLKTSQTDSSSVGSLPEDGTMKTLSKRKSKKPTNKPSL